MPAASSILVTGASSGIGNHLTRSLSARGHHVYATARKQSDLDELQKITNVTAIRLDVRERQQIEDAVAVVREAGRGLYALINNAGVGGLGFLSTFDDAAIHDLFDVNVFGPQRLTNALLPLLVAGGGRVVNIGSQGGMLTGKMFGPYCMTKHALEAYTVALSDELSPHGVHVSIVQPGGVVSAISAKSETETFARLENAGPPFEDEAREMLERLQEPETVMDEEEESQSNRKPSSPEIVLEAVCEAIFSETPRLRYMVGTRWEGARVIHALLEKLLDANRCPSLGYSRDELVALLDKEIPRRL